VAQKNVKYVDVVPAKAAQGLIRAVYDQARKEIGMLPDAVTMFSPSEQIGTASWGLFREALLSTGPAPRLVKEAVAAQVSKLNDCPFCVDAHSIMLYGGGAGTFATSLLSGAPELAGDPELTAVAEWAESVMIRPAGQVTAPFPGEQVPDVVGTLVEFHFLNRVINVLLAGTFLPGSNRVKAIARRVGGKVMAKRIKAPRAPGGAVGLAGGYPLPADLSWAAPQPAIGAALARLAATTEAVALELMPGAAIVAVGRALDRWDGQFRGPSRAWLAELLADLPAADQPAGRLALLTALAPFQVTDADVEAFRAEHPADADLVGLVSWAAFAAARRIGAWSVPAPAPV